MPPPEVVYSTSPSNVPALVQVPVGNVQVQVPLLGFDNTIFIVDKTVVCPTSRILNLTLPPLTSTGAQVSEFSMSKV